MKRRWIALTLLLALICSVLPVRTNAAQSKEERIKDLVRTTYSKALRRMGASSFLGYCGRAVNNQLYYLGIDTKVIGCDGKDEFDKYKDKKPKKAMKALDELIRRNPYNDLYIYEKDALLERIGN